MAALLAALYARFSQYAEYSTCSTFAPLLPHPSANATEGPQAAAEAHLPLHGLRGFTTTGLNGPSALGAWGAQRGGRLPTSRFAQAFSDSDGDPQDEEPALETEDSELDPEPEDLKQPVHLEMEAQMPPHLRQAWKRTLNRLSSLPLALAEMGAIAGLSAVGTVLEQGETAAFYAEKYPSQVGAITYQQRCKVRVTGVWAAVFGTEGKGG